MHVEMDGKTTSAEYFLPVAYPQCPQLSQCSELVANYAHLHYVALYMHWDDRLDRLSSQAQLRQHTVLVLLFVWT